MNHVNKILYCMRRYIPKTGKKYDLKILTNNNNYENYTIYQSDVELFDYMINYTKYNLDTEQIIVVYSEPDIMIDLIEMYLAIKCDTPYNMKDIYMAYKYLSPKYSFHLIIKMMTIYDDSEIETLIEIMDDVDIALYLIYDTKEQHNYIINNTILTRKNTILSLPESIFENYQIESKKKFYEKYNLLKKRSIPGIAIKKKNNVSATIKYLFDKLYKENRFFELNQLICSFSTRVNDLDLDIVKINAKQCGNYCGFDFLNLNINADDDEILNYFIDIHYKHRGAYINLISYLHNIKGVELTNKFLELTLNENTIVFDCRRFDMKNILDKDILLKYKYQIISNFFGNTCNNYKSSLMKLPHINMSELKKLGINLGFAMYQTIIYKSLLQKKDSLEYIEYLLYPSITANELTHNKEIQINDNTRFINYLLSEPDFFRKYTYSFLKTCKYDSEYYEYNIVYSGKDDFRHLEKINPFDINLGIYNEYCKLDHTNINNNMIVSNKTLYIEKCGKCIFENVHSYYKFIFKDCCILLLQFGCSEIVFISYNNTLCQYNESNGLLPCLLTKNFIIDYLYSSRNKKLSRFVEDQDSEED